MTPRPPAPDAVRAPTIALDPDPRSWAGLLRTHDPLPESHRRFRDQLGLPTDRPVIMAGHQPTLWHPGILAKLLAASALAARTGAAVAWLVVDFDETQPLLTRLPAFDPHGRLREYAWNPDGRDTPPPGVALSQPAVTPVPPRLPRGWTLPEWAGGRTDAARRGLAAHADAPSAAVQVTEALFDLLEPITTRPLVIHASRLGRTDLFAHTVALAAQHPQTLHDLYNAAVAHHPDADVRALSTRPDGALELPFWAMQDAQPRPVFDADLAETDPADADPATLLPRGLLMSGLARLAGCDLFIHGTGGRAYEPINDRWLTRWLDAPASGLAPFVTATADLTLDLDAPAIAPAEAARARWLAHHARHHPAHLGDAAAQRQRDALVAAIEGSPRGSTERARLFAELHALRRAHEHTHAEPLADLSDEARELTLAAQATPLAEDRTWPVFLHDPQRLRALRDQIDPRFF